MVANKAVPPVLVYWTAGATPTAAELADIEGLNARAVAPFSVLVMNASAQSAYAPGPTDEYPIPESIAAGYNIRGPVAFVAGGNPPPGWSAAEGNPPTFTVPKPGQPDGLIVAPATISMPHNGTLQLSAVTKDEAGNLHDLTTDNSVTWTSSDPTKATVGAHTGVVTGVAAGVVNIVASITATDGSGAVSTAHSSVTLT